MKNFAMNVTESKAESICPMNEMVWKQERCLRHDSNSLEHPELSCDDRDECASDNGGEDKTFCGLVWLEQTCL